MAYGASKGGVISLTKNLARAMRRRHGSMRWRPGHVDPGMDARLAGELRAAASSAPSAAQLNSEDIAGAIAVLCADKTMIRRDPGGDGG